VKANKLSYIVTAHALFWYSFASSNNARSKLKEYRNL